MAQVFCSTFLVAFLVFYSALLLILLGGGIRSALQSLLKRTRRARTPRPFRKVALFPKTQRN